MNSFLGVRDIHVRKAFFGVVNDFFFLQLETKAEIS